MDEDDIGRKKTKEVMNQQRTAFEKTMEEYRKEFEEFKNKNNKDKDELSVSQTPAKAPVTNKGPEVYKGERVAAQPAAKAPDTNKGPEVYKGERVAAQPAAKAPETNHGPVYYQGERVAPQPAAKAPETNHGPVYYQGERVAPQAPVYAPTTGNVVAEKIGSNTVTTTPTSITLVDKDGNRWGAQVNDQGTLDYSKNGEPVPPRDNNALNTIKNLNALAVSGPDSELKNAAVATGQPHEVTTIAGQVKVISIPHTPETLESAGKIVNKMREPDNREGNTIGNLKSRDDGR